MNSVVLDINSASVTELNTVYALLLHKGHGKSKTSDRSYRTISNYTVLVKALDAYIGYIYAPQWDSSQINVQILDEVYNKTYSLWVVPDDESHLHNIPTIQIL